MTVEYETNTEKLDRIESTGDASGTVEYSANYAAAVNYPTAYSGSSPPFEDIHAWVKRKWGDLSSGLKDAALEGVKDPSSISTAEHQKKVAWVVVNSIKDNGTEGLYFAERSLKFGQDKADKIAAKYEGTDDPLAAFKAVRDLTQLSFQHSQDIISGDVETGEDGSESAFDEGFLKRSGTTDISKKGGIDEKGDWTGGEE